MNSVKRVYFLGIGGIGMSAIARYFMHNGTPVAGYDRVRSDLTIALEQEGAYVCYDEDENLIPEEYRDPKTTLVVYTPAVPQSHLQYCYFQRSGFEIVKRSKMLGVLSQDKYVMAVAGTHGKTSTTTMMAYFNSVAGGGCQAFLGGVSKNFNSNLVLEDSPRFVVEADEYDRSFLQLYSDVAVVTSCDADHLDIYGTQENFEQAFVDFISQIKEGGAVVMHKNVNLEVTNPNISVYRYSADDQSADFHAENATKLDNGHYRFDFVTPFGVIKDCEIGIPSWVNVENGIAAAAATLIAGCDKDLLRQAMYDFKGVVRRFDFHINRPDRIYMDDFAHHPQELNASITSLRRMFPDRRLVVAFQPHLYSRTNDFYREFAEVLSKCDEVYLLPIYPARELPIEGVTSQMIADLMTVPVRVVTKEQLLDIIANERFEMFVSFGAGDISRLVGDITKLLS